MASLTLEKRPPIAVLTLARPERGNLLDGEAVRELRSFCEALADDADVRAVVITGRGEVFSRGWDIASLGGVGTPSDMVAAARGDGLLDDPFGCLPELPKAVVCALNGDAFGGGLALALACDLRVAGEGARLGLPNAGDGLLPMGGVISRLARLTGRARALEMLLTGETVDAEEALRIGLVGAVAPRERVLLAAEAIAQRIAERGPLGVQYAKEAVLRGTEMPLEQALRFETDLTVILQTTEDRVEGVQAFLDKRKPQFKGR